MDLAAFIWSPVRFFESRLAGPPRWLPALSAPLLCGVLDMSAVLILGAKNAAAAGPVLASGGVGVQALRAAHFASVLTLIGYPVHFALMALILTSADVLFKDSGRQHRLAEFAGLAFFAFVPGCLFMLGAAVVWAPEPVQTPAGSAFLDFQAAAARFADAMKADPWLSTARVVYLSCLGWCVALMGAALTVASGFGRRAACLASVLIFVAFSGFWR